MFALIVVFITCVANLLLGTLVLARNYRLNTGRAFFAICFFASVWAVSNYLTGLTAVDLSWNKMANSIAFLSAFLAVASVTWFSYNFPLPAKISSGRRAGLIGVTIAMASISGFPIVAGEVTKSGDTLYFSVEPLMFLYALTVIFLFGLAVRNFLRIYSHRGKERQQVFYILTGLSVPTILGLLTNVLIPSFTSSWQTASIGPSLTIFLAGMTAIAIIKHRLFDLRLAVARSLTYGLSIIAVVSIFMIGAFALSRYVFDFQLGFKEELILGSFSAVAALLFQQVKRFFDKFTNRFFYRDAYDPQQLFNDFSQAIVTNPDITQLLKTTTSIIVNTLKIDFCIAALSNKNASMPRIIGTGGSAFSEEDVNDGHRHLLRLGNPRVILGDYLDSNDPLKKIMFKNGIALIVRLKNEGDMGYLLFGFKRSGNIYNRQDLQVIEALADELVVAIQNSLHNEEIERFNDTLQEKIEAATRKLRHTNDKLRTLDQTKDDFISMASHQLRTPLTAVKGYVSMVLDGDAGKLTPLQRKLLNQSFISSQRMVYLISDLLNVSRLRTGKFMIEPVPCNLAQIIKDEVEQLQETAKSRNLELIFNHPEHFPTLMVDETKMRQVIMNFIDNAIYYTPSGGHIAINLVDKSSTIEFMVTDDGIGVPKEDQHHLFTKFFRAHNAKRARPDGTGLGLFMAKKVVVAQGGAIIFRSHEGKGSTFGFTFAKAKLLKTPTNEQKLAHRHSVFPQ